MLRSKRKPNVLQKQSRQLKEFKKRNPNLLFALKDSVLYQIWRDGFICGAIHGYDKCIELQKKKARVKAKR